MRFVFRTDASRTIGSGHVIRCLTLAKALRGRGATVTFVCREHDGHLCNLIGENGFDVTRLASIASGTQIEDTPAHAAWLGASWREDAEQTRTAIEASETNPDWLVVDHYALDRRWESALRGSVGRIMAIDDLADREHDCDLLLDQNLVAQMHTRYTGKVPATCGLLLGPEYALLQPIYAELHDRIPPREGPIRRIFVFFGGADSDNLTGRTLAAFVRLKRPDIEVDVVITPGGLHEKVLSEQAAGCANIHLYGALPTLAPLMIKADLSVGAGGATNWERLCLGLPTLVVSLADNQYPICQELARRSLIRWLGPQDKADEATIAQALEEFLGHDLDEDWSRRCLATTDGHGVIRVCAALTVTAGAALRVRHALPGDENLLLTWANDPTTRRNAFSPHAITAAAHRAWFRTRLRNPDGCRLYIAETIDGVALGYVRFERAGQDWEVHYALAPLFRRRGLGRRMVDAALLKIRTYQRGDSVFGQVKVDNRPSCRIFESLDFEAHRNSGTNVVVYRRTL